MNSWWSSLRILFLTLALLVVASPASAAVEVEPNDTPDDIVRQVALVDGSGVTGTLAAQNDYDGFRLQVGAAASARVEITVTNTSPAASGAVIGGFIGDSAGDQDFADSGETGLAPGQSVVLSTTLAAGGAFRFYTQFLCESDDPADCPGSTPGATWSAAVKVRSGSLVSDAGGALGLAAKKAADAVQDAMASGDDPTASAAGITASAKAACQVQGRAAKVADRKVLTARRLAKKHATPHTKRQLRTTRTRAARARTRFTDCTKAAEAAAKAAIAAAASVSADGTEG